MPAGRQGLGPPLCQTARLAFSPVPKNFGDRYPLKEKHLSGYYVGKIGGQPGLPAYN